MVTLYYINNRNNKRIAKSVENKFNFKPVLLSLAEARERLPNTEGKAILLWGDGDYHYLSYFFEIKKEYGCKIGIDAHLDTAPAFYLDSRSHFYHSENGNHDLFVYVPHWRGYSVEYASVKKSSKDYSHKHISVDMDFVKGFPIATWISGGSGRMEVLLSLLDKILDEKVMRFDIGGLKEDPTKSEFKKAMGMYMEVFELLAKKF
ncbi:MAG: hypothetical protein QXT05_01305 [Candidatus Bilamarchaeaceae archaeon]